MFSSLLSTRFVSAIVSATILETAAGMAVIAAEPGATRVAKWHADAKAPFMLMFDDSMTGHVKTVLPELTKRKLVGTFYINPGSGHYKAMQQAWEKEFSAAGMVLANHTFTHKGCKDVADCEQEITKCNDVLYAIERANGRARPTLLSFGRPGVPQGKWNVTDEELETLLKKHGLLRRPNVLFAQIHMKDAEAMIAHVDKALSTGKPDTVAFHGVGGEWLSIDTPAFLELLDHIEKHQSELWVTDPISIHKYETLRDTAEVKVEQATADEIRLTLSSKADPKIYGAPLTLVSEVPAAWKKVQVRQAERTTTVRADDGKIVYDAQPGADLIVLKPKP